MNPTSASPWLACLLVLTSACSEHPHLVFELQGAAPSSAQLLRFAALVGASPDRDHRAVTRDDRLAMRLREPLDEEEQETLLRLSRRMSAELALDGEPEFTVEITTSESSYGPWELILQPDEADADIHTGDYEHYCAWELPFELDISGAGEHSTCKNSSVSGWSRDKSDQRVRLKELNEEGTVKISSGDPDWAPVAEQLRFPRAKCHVTRAVFRVGSFYLHDSPFGGPIIYPHDVGRCRERVGTEVDRTVLNTLILPEIARNVAGVEYLTF